MAEEQKRHHRFKVILTIATFLALGALVYAVRDQVLETIANLGRVDTLALALMLPIQALNYDATTRMLRAVFGILGRRFDYKTLLKIVFELNFVNSVFPSGGVSGISYFGLRMKAFRVSAGKSTLVQIMRFILVFVSFQVLLFVGLFILALEGQANSLAILISGSLATLLLVGTVGLAFVIGSKKRINSFFTYITKLINKIIHVVRPQHPETLNISEVQGVFTDLHENFMVIKRKPSMLKRPLIYSLLVNLTEVMTIYVVFIAFGEWVNPGAVIIAYAIANFAGFVSVLPGGVGIYEGLMTAVLISGGVAAGVSIPVVIMYRMISIGMQLPPGYFFYHRAIHANNVKLET